MQKITEFFLTFIFICLLASLLLVKIPIPFNSNAMKITRAQAINENSTSNETKSWHVADVWKLSMGTVVLILINIRPIDCFANLCNEDEDVKRARLKTILYGYEKFRKITEKLELDILYLISWLGVVIIV